MIPDVTMIEPIALGSGYIAGVPQTLTLGCRSLPRCVARQGSSRKLSEDVLLGKGGLLLFAGAPEPGLVV
jgi:hypothetical protein